MAILAIFGGYFGYFLQNGLFLNSMIYHFGEPTGWAKKWPNQIFCQIDLDGEIVEMTCGHRAGLGDKICIGRRVVNGSPFLQLFMLFLMFDEWMHF